MPLLSHFQVIARFCWSFVCFALPRFLHHGRPIITTLPFRAVLYSSSLSPLNRNREGNCSWRVVVFAIRNDVVYRRR